MPMRVEIIKYNAIGYAQAYCKTQGQQLSILSVPFVPFVISSPISLYTKAAVS